MIKQIMHRIIMIVFRINNYDTFSAIDRDVPQYIHTFIQTTGIHTHVYSMPVNANNIFKEI